ncbi:MAG: hypothetical protein JO210_13500 [Acidobacteriaceae bacterium]|nr:hypothetical protein [Acidobacteriaceae bacterium]
MHSLRAVLILLAIASASQLSVAQKSPKAVVPSKTLVYSCCTASSTETADGKDSNGKSRYLIEVRELYPAPKGRGKNQKITLKLSCVPETRRDPTKTPRAPCVSDSPRYPLQSGIPFALDWSANSEQPVTLTWTTKGVHVNRDGSDPHVFTASGEGKIVFEAAQPGVPGQFAPANPVRLMLQVVDASHPPASLGVCGPPPVPVSEEKEPRLDAPMLVPLLGDPKPYTFVAQGKETLAIYSTRPRPTREDLVILRNLENKIIPMLLSKSPEELGIESPPKQFRVELTIPHAAALGNLSAAFSGLNYSQFQVQPVGSDRIRISSASTPSCEEWQAYLKDVRHLLWEFNSQPSSLKLFYLNSASEVSSALKGTTPPSPDPSGTADAKGSASKDAAPSSKTQVAEPQGSKSASDSATPAETKNFASSAPADKVASTGKSTASVAPLGTDFLVFGDSHPGDDAEIAEKRRIIAALDLPRPEMIISAWVLQNSSTNGQIVGNFNDVVQRTVSQNNEALQSGLLNAWRYLKLQMKTPEAYFDNSFYGYLVNRYVANLPSADVGRSRQAASEAYLENRSTTEMPGKKNSDARSRFGICEANQYCLGYIDLFRPLQPRLTDLLLALVAAKTPIDHARVASCKMENPEKLSVVACSEESRTTPSKTDAEFQKNLREKLSLTDRDRFKLETCELSDLRVLVRDASLSSTPGIKLNCFRQVAEALLDNGKSSYDSAQPSALGLLRAAIADFLFNYKLSQQYPHEFSAYELGRSADVLNSALRPIIDAFNRDVRTFQRFLGAELEVQFEKFNQNHSPGRFFKSDSTFVNNGLVTVRTISGQDSLVDTTSQNFLDASTAPQVSDLAKSILGQSTSSGTSSGSSESGKAGAAPDVLGKLSPPEAQLITGAIAAYQSSKIQIGRQLSLDVNPRSLNGAASAEITVKLNASESAPPNYWGGAKNSSSADLSRVASHTTTTRIRVDSIRIFDVSAFTAVLQRSRSRFPLLPPFMEIPYVGTVVGLPLPRASEYHSSAALLSAIVVPTAADIASLAVFQSDAIVDPYDEGQCEWLPDPAKHEKPCHIRRAISLHDFGDQLIVEFHRAKIHCLATNDQATNWKANATNNDACQDLTLDSVLHVAQ